jgi:hypothetical protein
LFHPHQRNASMSIGPMSLRMANLCCEGAHFTRRRLMKPRRDDATPCADNAGFPGPRGNGAYSFRSVPF